MVPLLLQLDALISNSIALDSSLLLKNESMYRIYLPECDVLTI